MLEPALRALAAGLFDKGAGVPVDRLDWTIDDVRSFLGHAGPRTSFLFYLVLAVLEWLPIVVLGLPSRFSRLEAIPRARFLERLDDGALSMVLVLPKAILSLSYFEHPDALAETGYDQGCLHGANPALIQIRAPK